MTDDKVFDFKVIESKWQKKWAEEKVFEANPDDRKKFFVNFPYPYINAYLHLGHGFSSSRLDILIRFKRMNGYNALFPQAWHCTGTPVWAASQRIKEKEPKQWTIMRAMGFSDEEIAKFDHPKHWIDTFVPAAKEDFSKMGASIDWRRSFITTDLNPRYDKFIRWQFRKLKEKGYVAKGKHPVVWCPKDLTPIGDHDRADGEGETPQEFNLLKFKCENYYLIAATLRPETIFGETNFWVNPNVDYVKAKVNDEEWIISEECLKKLENQDRKITVITKINGKELIGKHCQAPMINKKIIVLPAEFVDPSVGTGLVTSVPSDAPYDYIALRDLQHNDAELKKYGLNSEEVKNIKPIPIIDSKEWGDTPAVKIVDKMGIKNQKDPKLEEATQIIYKAGFYSGVMNKTCEAYAGMSVEAAKEKMKEDLKKLGLLEPFYELSGKVVCRCLTPAVVKIVSDQWFLKYGDKKWKQDVKDSMKDMTFYPEIVRNQFNYVIDWLNDWACTHHHGTGTHLPWDEKWVIESLSDSTIYMAFYTIAHHLEKMNPDDINDELFDYVFLSKGEGKKEWDVLKKEFEYWYPFDVRSSGKDLVQNHLSFCLFNHAAIFPKKYFPTAFGVNGWLLVEGEKMSKSKGNFFTIRDMLSKYPADVIRISLILGGEGLDDPNFNFDNAKTIVDRLEQWHNYATENYKQTESHDELNNEDKLFLSAIHRSLKEGSVAMDNMLFRTGFDKLFYQMQKSLKKYLSKPNPNQILINEFIEIQTQAISPFCPHITEEIWHKIGKKGFVSTSDWPVYDESLIDEKVEFLDEMKTNTRLDIIKVLQLAKIDKPKNITLFVSAKWKYEFIGVLKEKIAETRDFKEIMNAVLKKEHLKPHAQDITKMIPSMLNDQKKIPSVLLDQDSEKTSLEEAKESLEKEFGAEIKIIISEQSHEAKAKQANPGKPAIIVD